MRRSLSLLVSISWFLNACTSWQAEQVAPATYIESQHPGKVRLTLQDSTQLTLHSPAVVGDSIVGTIEHDSAPHAVARHEVQKFEVRRTSAGRTVALIAGIAVGLVVGFFGLWAIECSAGCWD